jgi:hypothetical protein
MLIHFAIAVTLAMASKSGGQEPSPPRVEALEVGPEWKGLGRSVWFDPRSKRLVIRARVVLREGVLEHLMCSKGTKEHEAILATDAPPRQIHAGLLLTGAEPGHPVRFVPKFEPPTGSRIAVDLSWLQEGQIQHSDARQWVKDEKSKKPLGIDWVFAGSEIFEDPVSKQPRYAADDGDLFTVANFGNAILDLPIASSANDADRVFSTNTEKIPPLGTEVFLALSPRVEKANRPSTPAANPKP